MSRPVEYLERFSKELIQQVLKDPSLIVKKIIKSYSMQCESYYDMDLNEKIDLTKIYILDTIDDINLVTEQWFASEMFDILEPPIQNQDLNSFEELIKIIATVNPYWILEQYKMACLGNDFARCTINNDYEYEASNDELKEIKKFLSLYIYQKNK